MTQVDDAKRRNTSAHARSVRDSAGSLVVLETSRPPRPVVRYLDQVVGSAHGGLSFRYADANIRSLNIDILHLHPGRKVTLLGTRETASKQRLLAALGFVLRLKCNGISIVRTVQGAPDETPRLAQRLLDRATTLFIVLDPSTSTPSIGRTVVIPHMHYRERYVGYPRSTMIGGRIVCFMSTAPPSAADALAETASLNALHDTEIRLIGPADKALSLRLRDAAGRAESRLSLRGGMLSDGAMVQEICSAELVIVPRFETMDDLQITFAALSLDRPVFLPADVRTQQLREEVGREWVFIGETITDVDAIDATLAAVRNRAHTSRPNLDRRDPHVISAAYAEAFRGATLRSRHSKA